MEPQWQRVSSRPKIQKVEKRSESLRPFAFISFILILASLLGFWVYGMVQLNETTSQINQLQKELKIQQSDQVRLDAELESKINMANLDAYAKQNLGLVEPSSSQTTYMNLSDSNTIEISKAQDQNWLTDIICAIQDFFS